MRLSRRLRKLFAVGLLAAMPVVNGTWTAVGMSLCPHHGASTSPALALVPSAHSPAPHSSHGVHSSAGDHEDSDDCSCSDCELGCATTGIAVAEREPAERAAIDRVVFELSGRRTGLEVPVSVPLDLLPPALGPPLL